MKNLLSTLFLMGMFAFSIACKKTEIEPDTISISGFLQKTGVTTYQYGTHHLKKDKISTENIGALFSKTINLDDFIDQQVKITGTKVKGYPVDGGLVYVQVTAIVKE